MTKKKYPRINGKRLTKEQKMAFDKIALSVVDTLAMEVDCKFVDLSLQQIDVLSHNIATNLVLSAARK